MLNKAVLMGRLTADPNASQTPNGVNVATFTLAVARTYNRDITDFINIVAWRQTADFVSRYFTKGQLVVVEGSIQTRNYEDKQCNKRIAFEVMAEQVYFAESKGNTDKNNNNIPMPTDMDEPAKGTSFSIDIDEYEEVEEDEGDLPF